MLKITQINVEVVATYSLSIATAGYKKYSYLRITITAGQVSQYCNTVE